MRQPYVPVRVQRVLWAEPVLHEPAPAAAHAAAAHDALAAAHPLAVVGGLCTRVGSSFYPQRESVLCTSLIHLTRGLKATGFNP